MHRPISTTAFISKRGRGYLPDPKDDRDFLIGSSLPTTPPLEYLPRHGLTPLYQKGNSCTGRVVQAYRIGEFNHGREWPELSGLYNYALSRIAWGGFSVDNGSYCREAVKALVNSGAAHADKWRETAWNVQRKPSAAAQRTAHKFRGIKGYYRIPSGDLDGMRRVLASGFCVFAGWSIDKAFLDGDGPTIIDRVTGPRIGGHAFLLDGYTAHGLFHCQNSWRGWRATKYGPSSAWLTDDFVADAFDIWAIVTWDRI